VFEHLSQKKQNFEQVTTASENIDKLAKIINFSQQEMRSNSAELQDKKHQLEKTKVMLSELKITTEQLQYEIRQLKSNQETSDAEKTALSVSIKTLLTQFASLNTQLEDNYLTIDINEAFIEYQENDLNDFKQTLAKQINAIQLTEQSLEARQDQVTLLQQALSQKDGELSIFTQNIEKLDASLSEFQKKYRDSQARNANLEQEISQLKDTAPQTH